MVCHLNEHGRGPRAHQLVVFRLEKLSHCFAGLIVGEHERSSERFSELGKGKGVG